MSDDAMKGWSLMASAPKDGTRILVVTRAGEQGPADVDVVRWTKPGKATAEPCWVSTESSHDCAIFYDDWEVSFWMPLPESIPPVRGPGLKPHLPPVPRGDGEAGGSGI